ncbi:RNA 2'-O ribose methyltransferase substrate binding [Nakaseomyces glabratus]|nr:RNA 2'-O ribose methyltransferase substrate binding [Nakaseomyces glabratus]
MNIAKRWMSIRPAVKDGSPLKRRSVDRNIPVYKTSKAWERDGLDKDTWFRKTYAHVHADQKKRQKAGSLGKREAHEQRLDGICHSYRDNKNAHRQKFKNLYTNVTKFAINPLSEYLYGVNPILAALESDRRGYFTRLLHHDTNDKDSNKLTILRLCKEKGIKIDTADKHQLNLITKSAVHNNMVLECKPLSIPEINSLQNVNIDTASFNVLQTDGITQWSKSEKFHNNERKKYPVGIYLDEVTDPHNMGAIIRSAFFLGADFVALSRKNCAAIGPVVAKTSSGAVDYLPMFYVDKPLKFFELSQAEGWTVVSSSHGHSKKDVAKTLDLGDLHNMSHSMPILLVMGNEYSGIRTNLKQRSDFLVAIPQMTNNSTVDSLNVSVATGILLSKLV